MDHALDWLWQGCVVALATHLTLRLLARTRAQARYVLCWVALLTVLLLPAFSFVGIDPTLSADSSFPGQTPIAPIVSVPIAWWTSTSVLGALWVCWSGVHGARMLSALLALRRARRECLPFPMAAEAPLRHWEEMRLQGRQAQLVLSHRVRSAAVLGGGSPLIAVAPALVDHLSADELDRVVIHEWVHVQRRDDVLNLFHLAARALSGWHPAVWWLDRQLRIERESACDEGAVAVTGCAKLYAASLARTAGLLPVRRSTLPALGAWSSPGLSQRVVRILSHSHLVSTAWSMSAATAAAAAVCAMAVAVAGFRVVGMETMALADGHEPVQAVVPDRIVKRVAMPQLPRRASSVQERSGRTQSSAGNSRAPAPETIAASGAPPPSDSSQVPVPAGRFAVVDFPATVKLLSALDAPPASTTTTVSAPASAPPTPVDWPSSVAAAAADAGAAAADAGTAVGRASQRAAMSTAGVFTRLGKKIAGSF